MLVRIPSPLRSYTQQKSTVQAAGATIHDVLADLDAQYPGIRFRMLDEQDAIRPHIRLFINSTRVDDLSRAVTEADTVHIICALSGG